MTATSPITVRLPTALAERLEVLATRTRRSKAVYVREALEAQLEKIEWEQEILARSEDIRAGRATLHTDAEVRQYLGLDS